MNTINGFISKSHPHILRNLLYNGSTRTSYIDFDNLLINSCKTQYRILVKMFLIIHKQTENKTYQLILIFTLITRSGQYYQRQTKSSNRFEVSLVLGVKTQCLRCGLSAITKRNINSTKYEEQDTNDHLNRLIRIVSTQIKLIEMYRLFSPLLDILSTTDSLMSAF